MASYNLGQILAQIKPQIGWTFFFPTTLSFWSKSDTFNLRTDINYEWHAF